MPLEIESNRKNGEVVKDALELLEREYLLGFNKIIVELLNRELSGEEKEVIKKALLSLVADRRWEEVSPAFGGLEAVFRFLNLSHDRVLGLHIDILNRSLDNLLGNTEPYKEKRLLFHELGRLLLSFLFRYALSSKERLLTEGYITIDMLTGLPNRQGFMNVLSKEMEVLGRAGESFGLIYLDLDNLSLINDMYGYALGDLVLIRVAEILKEEVGDVVAIGRIGGDEFGIILREGNLSTLLSKANAVKERISSSEVEFLAEEGVSITSSVGVAIFPQDGRAMDDLLFAAELACSCAKRKGGNRVEFAKNIKKEDVEVPVAFHEYFIILQKALKGVDDTYLFPYYQPVVDLENREIIGYEILARIHREGKPLPARLFIETAEKTGLIFELGRKIIESAFAEKNVSPLKDKLLFINFSAREVENPETICFLADVLEKYNVESKNVVVEITERGAARDLGAVLSFSKELARLGIRLAIDDFGSGFSSFLYVRYLDPYFVKIAGSLIHEIIISAKAKMLLEGIVRFFKGMSVEVIAEHVENVEMVEILKRVGVRYAQGFYLGRPSRTPQDILGR